MAETTTVNPPAFQMPYLQYGMEQARGLYDTSGPNFFPNRTYVPFSGQTEQALGLTENRALMGSPVDKAMQGYVTGTLSNQTMGQPSYNYLSNTLAGNYLGGGDKNPYLDATFDQASKQVTDAFNKSVIPSLNASFSRAGGSGSGIQQELALDSANVLGQNLTNLATNIYGKNFQNERDRQNQAASTYGNVMSQVGNIQGRAAQMAPTASALDYANIDRLGGVGQAVEGKANQILQDQMNRFNYYQNRPEQNLGNYMGYVTGDLGRQQSTEGSRGSSTQNAIGGALALGQLFNEIGGENAGWWGAGLGALGGLLSS